MVSAMRGCRKEARSELLANAIEAVKTLLINVNGSASANLG
jgi:hypothetical protein